MAVQQLKQTPSQEALLERARQARDKGIEWAIARIAPDGEPINGLEQCSYYRLPWTLALAGERSLGARVLSWIERNVLTDEGDFAPGPARDAWMHRWSSYPLAIIASGAWHLERYDTASAVMTTLAQFQDPSTGGAYAERPEVRQSQRQDLFPTAQLGMTALATGRRDVADAAFRWHSNLFDAQQELPHRLLTGWDEDGLITEFANENDEFELVTDLRKPMQLFYNPGIAAAFLGRYFMATGNARARDLGRDYLRLSAEGTERQFDYNESKQVCKFGWGAAVMLEADPAGGHLDHVVQMAEWFIASQFDDGHWENSPFLAPNPSEADNLELVAEFTMHLSTILGALGSPSRGATVR